MANFQAHLNAGIFASGAAVLALHAFPPLAAHIPEGQTLTLFALGVAGSLLPDIDADDSAPVRAFFGVLGAVLAFAWTLPLVGIRSPWELALAWAALFVGVRVLFYTAFARFTVHRGIWHSWLAAAFAGLAAVHLVHWLLHWPAAGAWLAGLMTTGGYFVHLTLDELSSLDLTGRRVKRSFGTALKPFNPSDPLSSLGMLTAVVVLAWWAPEARWTEDFAREAARYLHGPDQEWASGIGDAVRPAADWVARLAERLMQLGQ